MTFLIKISFILSLIYSAQGSAYGALDLESLNTPFIEANDYRSLSVEELSQIEEALHELGKYQIWLNLQEKLGIYEKEGMSLYLKTCDLKEDTLGTYSRPSTNSHYRGFVFGVEPDNYLSLFNDLSLESALKNSYRWSLENNGVYISLAITSWPVICIRPGMKFGRVLSTFAHEVEHFVGDIRITPSVEEGETQEEFILRDLHRSGGEYNAFLAGVEITLLLQNNYKWLSYSTILKHFDDQGNVIDSEALGNYILDDLKYRQRISHNYQVLLTSQFESRQRDHNFIDQLRHVYANNANAMAHNVTVGQNNIIAYNHNMGIYQARGDQAAVAQTLLNIQTTQAQLIEDQKSYEFFMEKFKAAEAALGL